MSDFQRLREFAEWAKDTRDDEGIPARYEEISDRAEAALRNHISGNPTCLVCGADWPDEVEACPGCGAVQGELGETIANPGAEAIAAAIREGVVTVSEAILALRGDTQSVPLDPAIAREAWPTPPREGS